MFVIIRTEIEPILNRGSELQLQTAMPAMYRFEKAAISRCRNFNLHQGPKNGYTYRVCSLIDVWS